VLRIIIPIFYFIVNLQGQEPIQSQSAIPDSSINQPSDSLSVQVDSLLSNQAEPIKPIPYPLEPVHAHFLKTSDTSFVQNEIISTIYNGFADIFRQKSDYHIYDFLEMGQPRFVAPLHLLPHQGAVFYEGHFANDPLHGMYNLRFLSLDATESVEVSSGGFNATGNNQQLLNSINVNGRVLNPEKPYTRIMFRQGDFGYTDLDIQFAQSISDHLSIQFSGLNKLNDVNVHHGVIYQGAINFQASPNLSSRTQVRVNDDKMKIYRSGDYSLFTYSEEREELLQSFTYFFDPQKKERLHIRAGFSGNRRRNSSAVDSIKVKYRFQRAHFDLERNLITGPLNWSGGFSYNQIQVWGKALDTDYNQTNFNGFIGADYSLSSSINIIPSIKWEKYPRSKTQLSSSLTASYHIVPSIQFQVDMKQGQRQPNANELYFEYENFHGNPDLNQEKITSISAKADAVFLENFRVEVFSAYREIKKEILFDSLSFQNGPSRSFAYVGGSASLSQNHFGIATGGQVSSGKNLIGPEHSAWLQLNYHDVWLKGALIIDAIGQARYYGSQNRIQYHPVMERFYPSETQFDPFLTLSYKIVATVKSAQLYVAMDNPLSTEYAFIEGYPEFYRRVRFGVNWVLWE